MRQLKKSKFFVSQQGIVGIITLSGTVILAAGAGFCFAVQWGLQSGWLTNVPNALRDFCLQDHPSTLADVMNRQADALREQWQTLKQAWEAAHQMGSEETRHVNKLYNQECDLRRQAEVIQERIRQAILAEERAAGIEAFKLFDYLGTIKHLAELHPDTPASVTISPDGRIIVPEGVPTPLAWYKWPNQGFVPTPTWVIPDEDQIIRVPAIIPVTPVPVTDIYDTSWYNIIPWKKVFFAVGVVTVLVLVGGNTELFNAAVDIFGEE
jgi:hypothetical protein